VVAGLTARSEKEECLGVFGEKKGGADVGCEAVDRASEDGGGGIADREKRSYENKVYE
jgi:hypothetical protein